MCFILNLYVYIYRISSQALVTRMWKYCIKGNVNVCLIFPNLPNGLETGTIKTLSLIIFVGMVWQTMFADDDVSESEFSVCVKI